ncbi:helix-turn-helix transcriptional regulator [Sphingobium nicotianae]|uniref:helix-turn-helix transcriptional regulator n=1 Tax=Sphingobium nicotianae TaxID=2782607 RepID=UPI001BE42729
MSVWVLEALDGFGDAEVHAHHAIQISLCLSGALALVGAGKTVRASGIAVAADFPHRLEAQGLMAFIFVEPESRVGRALRQGLLGQDSMRAFDTTAMETHLERLRATFVAGLDVETLLDAAREAVNVLAPGAPALLPDPRIQKIIDYANAHLDEPLSLAEASAGVHLSPSRLRHLFVEQTGLAFKTYMLWLRLVRAVQVYSEGQSLTEAAHAAGFSDSAHFSRVFRRTFGTPATHLTRL